MELTVTMGVAPLAAEGRSMQLQTDTGYTVTLDRAYLSLGAVEIHGCNETGGDALLRRWFGPKLALAHTTSSPTRIGEPFVLSLLARDREPVEIGMLRPPPGDYCVTQVDLEAADDDARGLPDDVDVVGATLDVAGSWSNADESGQDFQLRTATGSERSLEQPFSLSRNERQRTLALRALVDHAFDGVEFTEQTETEQAKTVLSNIAQGLEARMQ